MFNKLWLVIWGILIISSDGLAVEGDSEDLEWLEVFEFVFDLQDAALVGVDDLEVASQLQLLTSWKAFARIELLVLVGVPLGDHLTILRVAYVVSLCANGLHVERHTLKVQLVHLFWSKMTRSANFTAKDSRVDAAMIVHTLERSGRARLTLSRIYRPVLTRATPSARRHVVG